MTESQAELASELAGKLAIPPAPRTPVQRKEPPTRRTALTVDAIVTAAIEVLDEGGVTALSMRRVADRLGTGPASLYAHISSKDELLELVYDEMVGRVSLPEPDPARWREQIHQTMTDFRDVLVSHRDVALAGLGRIPTTPKTLEGAENLVAILRAGGLTNRVITLGLDQLILYVSACAFESGLYQERGYTQEQHDQYMAEVDAFYEALPAERFPVLASVDMTGRDAAERFRFGLDVILSGLEVESERERRVS